MVCSLPLKASVFSFARVRPSKSDALIAVISLTVAFFAGSIGSMAASSAAPGSVVSSSWLPWLCVAQEVARGMLYFLFAGAGLTVLLCAAVPFHLSSRVFFRCDARVAVRALRFFVGVALFLGITEVFAMKPTAEMFFILSFFAFVVEHPKKAARIAGISTALAVLTVELTAAAIGASVCLTTLLVDAAAICCGLFSLAFVRALGLRMPQ